ncbi:transcriptional regulator, TraR/DksA family [Paenibacillus uliginis N3/975]|uniref:Transcriptional regulator, TraR/DksA family n=1 Tax=Paenibacillus uliginis N3/975 TaxID=1313296 RepID=A0A1X7HKH8_9BACL|nr:TraR/DksA C4-type zinc finger protein [Paenibacillus uliginis]SMF88345.1 transcriptional regulator, TraR/DksA family [Paenibacillus uliginis N3/975]
MSHLTEAELKQLHRQLLDRKAELERLNENKNHGLSISERDTTGELSHIDNHPGDLATELYDREKDVALQDRAELELQRVLHSLDTMKDGQYGTCVVCGKPIPFERLQAIPDTMYCLEDTPRKVLSHNRPIEEEFLSPPFGRSSLDEHEYSGFDGEDTLQILENMGSSNSPAMAENPNISSYNEMDFENNDDQGGFVEIYENFVATNIDNTEVFIVRGDQYYDYLNKGEGSYLLDPHADPEDDPMD